MGKLAVRWSGLGAGGAGVEKGTGASVSIGAA